MTLNACPTWSQTQTFAVPAHTAKRGDMVGGLGIQAGRPGGFAAQFAGSYGARSLQRQAAAFDRDVNANLTQPPVC